MKNEYSVTFYSPLLDRRETTLILVQAEQRVMMHLFWCCNVPLQPPRARSVPQGKHGVRVDDWRRAFYRAYGEDGKSEEATKKAFQRAKDSLIADKIVGCTAPWCWIW